MKRLLAIHSISVCPKFVPGLVTRYSKVSKVSMVSTASISDQATTQIMMRTNNRWPTSRHILMYYFDVPCAPPQGDDPYQGLPSNS